ncbi:hypothetical protein HYH03_012974 [Edaphochlamys debaryana]|uniref:Piezo non-specific cation channel R-Ras-binding domain-containing protein n=1 Tax=Edaphochlamys debaryana TaxID=47281 RepID=A0A836BUZ5_9CHLO|nr:hypothetical protein HYH03_012974 [Edaphochlamys debaryana]|eukprot:KAG2488469.1 hypothetical protein HYH03_012974 [Edaphochlamys debaryana]
MARRYSGRALLAAAALAAAAYSNTCPAGACYLLLFLAWGLVATRRAAGASPRAAVALWSLACAASAAALLTQLVVPLVALSGGRAAAAVGPGSVAWWVLGLRDLTASGSVWQLLAILLPPLVLALASLSEAQDAYAACVASRRTANGSGSASGGGRREAAAARLDPNSAAAAGSRAVAGQPPPPPHPRRDVGRGSGGHTLPSHAPNEVAGALAGLLLALAALLWPAAFNVPWLAVASLAVGLWSARAQVAQSWRAPLLRLCQCYCGACLAALYGWQLPPPPGHGDTWPPAAAEKAARALGLYRLDPAEEPLYNFVPQVLHLAALTALYGALGFAARAAGEAWRRRHLRHVSSHRSAVAPLSAATSLTPAPPPASAPGSAALTPVTSGTADRPSALAVEPPPVLQPLHVPGSRHARPHSFSGPHHGPPHLSRHAQSFSAPHHPRDPGGAPSGPSGSGRGVATRLLAAWEALSAHPGLAAVLLACLSLVEVSVVGWGMLALGMWTLLAPGRYGRRVLRRASPGLTGVLLGWNAAVYVLTCLAESYPDLLPPVLHSLGLFMFTPPPPALLPLAGQALVILAVAGLARSTRCEAAGGDHEAGGASTSAASGGDGGRAAPAASGAGQGQGLGVAGSPLGLTLVLLLYHGLHVLVPLAWILVGAYRLDLLHAAYMAWALVYCGATALRLSPSPRVGAVLPDAYDYDTDERTAGSCTAGMSKHPPAPGAVRASYGGRQPSGAPGDAPFGESTASLTEPLLSPSAMPAGASPPSGLKSSPPLPLPATPPAHRLLRFYASVHLLALYGGLCVQLPGLGALQRPDWQRALALVGLWAPDRLGDCLPLLAALVLATAHAVAGKILQRAAGAASAASVAAAAAADSSADAAASPGAGAGGEAAAMEGLGGPRTAGASAPGAHPGPPVEVQAWLVALGSWLGGSVASLGGLLVAALLYSLALGDPRLGLAGLGYVGLGLPLLLAPPLRQQYAARLRLSHHRTRPGQPLPYLYLSATAAPGQHSDAAMRWLGPAALALYGAADLVLSYTAATVWSYEVAAGGDDAVPADTWWRRLIILLYGGEPYGQGARLMLVLVRPACLLLALQLYRWVFAAAAVTKWLYGGAGPRRAAGSAAPPPAAAAAAAATAALLARRLAKQASAAWLLKRWLILNLDVLTCLLVFAAVMQSPGALAAAFLGAGIVAAVLGAWAAAAKVRRARREPRPSQGGGGAFEFEFEDAADDDEEAMAVRSEAEAAAAAAARACRGRIGDAAVAAGFWAAAELALAAWLLALYALQLEPVSRWLRSHSLVPAGGDHPAGAWAPWSPAAVLDWLGLPTCTPLEAPAGPAGPAGLAWAWSVLGGVLSMLSADGADAGEGGLAGCTPAPWLRRRLVALLLTLSALALRRKANSWRSKLPPQLVLAAAPGQPCCLLWPPPWARPDSAILPWLGPSAPLRRALRRVFAPPAAAVNTALNALGRGAYGVLKAMDVPADQLVPASDGGAGGPEATADVGPEPLGRRPTAAMPPGTGLAPPAATQGRLSSFSRSLSARGGLAGIGLGVGIGRGAGPAGPAVPAAAAAKGLGPGVPGAGLPPTQPAAAASAFGSLPGAGAVPAEERASAPFASAADWDAEGGWWLLLMRLVIRGCMEAAETAWLHWGGEAALLALLAAAFTACSALSLPLLGLLGMGMAARPAAHASLRRGLVLPLLAAALLYQYCAWVGLTRLALRPTRGGPGAPPLPDAAAWLGLHPALAAWLGLQGAGPLLVWTLFGALMACVMQVNTELNQHWGAEGAEEWLPPRLLRASLGRMGLGAGSVRWLRRMSFRAGSPRPDGGGGGTDNDLEAPLLSQEPPSGELPPPPPDRGSGSLGPGLRPRPSPLQVAEASRIQLAAAGGGRVSGGGGARASASRRVSASGAAGQAQAQAQVQGRRTLLFSPVEVWAQPYWGVLDWARYYMVRHAADLLLVALVGLVALQRDLLRAGYLAIALLLFRRRPELRAPRPAVAGEGEGGGRGPAGVGGGGALFGRLVGFNFLVLLLEGLFQAPWPLLLGPAWALPCSAVAAASPDAAAAPACTLPRLLGLCRLQPGRDDWTGTLSWARLGPLVASFAFSALGAPDGPPAPGLWEPWRALLTSPVAADVVVWVLLRLYVRCLRSSLFTAVSRVEANTQLRRLAAARRAGRDELEAAARGALAASHARAVRARRIAKLKALLLLPGDAAPSDGPGGGALGSLATTEAAAAYVRAMRSSSITGGGGSGGQLLFATGGGPMVAGLAELLDADVDLAEVAAAAAAAGGDVEALQRQHMARRRRQQLVAAGGGGGAGAGQADRPFSEGGAVRWGVPEQRMAMQDAIHEGDAEGLDLAGTASGLGGGGLPRSGAHRRVRSTTDLPLFATDDDATPAATPLGTSPSGLGGSGGLLGDAAQSSSASAAATPGGAAALSRQRSGGGAQHRRQLSAETLESAAAGLWAEPLLAGAGGGRRDSGLGRPTPLDSVADAEIEPLAAGAAAGPGVATRAGGGGGGGGGPRRRRPLSWPPILVWLYGRTVAPVLAFAQRRRSGDSDDSVTAYAAFLVFFLADMSASAAVLPLSMFLYALLLRVKPRRYWQGALLYAEALLIAQYGYLVLGRCLCGEAGGSGGASGGAGGRGSCIWVFGRRDFLFWVQALGLHDDPLRALPLFLVYLATLMHTYSLDRVYAAVSGPPLYMQLPGSGPGGPLGAAGRSGSGSSAGGAEGGAWLSWRRLRRSLRRAAAVCRALALHLRAVYGLVTAPHEVGPYWVKLQLQRPLPSAPRPPTAMPSGLPSAPASAAGRATSPAELQPGSKEAAGGSVGASGLPPRPRPASAPPEVVAAPAALQPPVEGVAPAAGAAQAPADLGAYWRAGPVTAAVAASLGDAGGEGRGLAPAGLPPPSGLQQPFGAAAVPSAAVPGLAAGGPGAALVMSMQDMVGAVYSYGEAVRRSREAAEEARRERRRRRAVLREVFDGEDVSDDRSSTGERSDDEGSGSGSGGRSGSGGAAAAEPAAAAVATRAAAYTLPRLRLQHEAVAASGASVHVLLQVLPWTGSGGGGGGGGRGAGGLAAAAAAAGGGGAVDEEGLRALQPSPTPARDVAAMLQCAAEATKRQRLAALSVPPFRGQPGGSGAASAAPSGELPPLVGPGGAPEPPPPDTAAAGLHRRGTRPSPPPPAPPPSTSTAPLPPPPPSHRRQPSLGAASDVSASSAVPPPPPPPAPPPPELRLPDAAALPAILSVEHHAAPARDFYTATAFLDILSFLYALVFYQLVASSAASLADIADADRRLPLDYLAALMLLFALLVAERAVYVLGWPGAKMALHVASQALVLGWSLGVYWRSVAADAGVGRHVPASGGHGGGSEGVRSHLRVFVLLRCLGFCLGALQLRDGYPPLSAPGPAGGGRHASFFYRRADWAHNLAFNVFYSLPFLYEIRTLLDWTCVTTSLDWYSWLKLEDIRSSLFVATCRNQSNKHRRIGERVPRYVKASQGVLALAALLLVLWLPPLFFSSGAPTYQVPSLQDVRVNVSLAQVFGGSDAASVQRFPIFAAGDRRAIFRWTVPEPPPPPRPPAPPPAAPLHPPAPSPAQPPRPRLPLSPQSPGAEAPLAPEKTASVPDWLHAGSEAPQPAGVLTAPNRKETAAERRGLAEVAAGGGGGGLPRALAGYAPEQAMAGCFAPESDSTWRASPPARAALAAALAAEADPGQSGDPAPVVLEVRWLLTRSAPLSSAKGGPGCAGGVSVPLSLPSRKGLAQLLVGATNRTLLTAANATDPAAHGSPGLFPLFLRLRGDACSVRLGLQGDGGGGSATPPLTGRGPQQSLAAASQRRRGLLERLGWGAWRRSRGGVDAVPAASEEADRWGDAMVGCYAVLASEGGGGGWGEWWSLECGALLPPGPGGDGDADADDGAAKAQRRRRGLAAASAPLLAPSPSPSPAPQPDPDPDPSPELLDACAGAPGGSRALQGPPLVAVLEPVQSGLLGETLSRFGITGLYITFVLAIGRFLRLSVSSLRLRIPTEDLPSTRRLVALCQDVAVARAEGELVLEEQLFRALINVYRSPELLFELSKKHKQAAFVDAQEGHGEDLLDKGSTLENGIFGVLFTLSKESSESRIRYRWILLKILLDAWQLFATVVNPAKQGWDIDPDGPAWTVVGVLNFVWLSDLGYGVYLLLLYAMVFLLVINVMLCVWVAWCFSEQKFPVVLRVFSSVFFQAFDVACLNLLQLGIACRYTGPQPHLYMSTFMAYSCASAPHLIHAVVSALALILFVAIALLLNMAEVEVNPTSRRPFALGHSGAEVAAFAVKVLLTLVDVFLGWNKVAAVAYLVLSLAHAWPYLRRNPHLVLWVNCLKSGVAMAIAWVSTCLVLLVFEPGVDGPAEQADWQHNMTVIMLAGLGPTALLGVALSYTVVHRMTVSALRALSNAKPETPLKDVCDSIDDPRDVEVVARCGRVWRDRYTLDPEAVARAHQVIKAGLAMFPSSAFMVLLHANFMIDVLGVHQSGSRRIEDARKLSPSLMCRFIMFVRHQQATQKAAGSNANDGASMDLLDYVEYQRKQRMVVRLHKEALQAMCAFWRALDSSTVSFVKLSKALGSIERSVSQAQTAYRVVLESYGRDPKLVRLYGKFLESIKNDPWGAAEYYAEADRLEETKNADGKGPLLPDEPPIP